MTVAMMKCTISPLLGLWSSIMQTAEVVGYSRAAAQLTSLGYHEEAKKCMLEIQNLRQTGEK
tara:strand:- start:47 stop:232 length:186 start_codon:yes stop_codon:yes gene_type:complete